MVIWIISTLGNFYGPSLRAKRERKLAEKKAKRLAKEGTKKEEDKKSKLDPSKPISLDFLTNPNKEWIQKIKMSV